MNLRWPDLTGSRAKETRIRPSEVPTGGYPGEGLPGPQAAVQSEQCHLPTHVRPPWFSLGFNTRFANGVCHQPVFVRALERVFAKFVRRLKVRGVPGGGTGVGVGPWLRLGAGMGVGLRDGRKVFGAGGEREGL